MKRLLRQFAICMLLGVVITIAVAWGCALWVEVGDRDLADVTVSRPPGWFITRYERPGVRWSAGWALFEAGDLWTPGGHINWWKPETGYTQDAEAEFARAPLWGWPNRFNTAPDRAVDQLRFVIADARGWPLPALWRELSVEIRGAVVERTDELTKSLRRDLWGAYAPQYSHPQLGAAVNAQLPMKPIWWPLIVDAAAFAAVALAMIRLAALMRLVSERWSRRRQYAAVAACAILGGLTTIGVAWSLLAVGGDFVPGVSRQPGRYGRWYESPGSLYWETERLERAGCFWLTSRWTNPRTLPSRDGEVSQPAAEALVPWWADFARPGRTIGGESSSLRELTACGWPALALWSGSAVNTTYPNHRTTWRVGGIEIALTPSGQPSLSSMPTAPITLPWYPIWHGFVIDSAIYGYAWTVLMTLALTPKLGKRNWRRRRGRCEQCGYDLRGEFERGCPECGWERGNGAASLDSNSDAGAAAVGPPG